MLRLKNVSKFYSSGGVVTQGFTKVNLELDSGEFVAITGESGSGKSTLLNVISGLDSYEEGEMYIFGEPTSGSTETEKEQYRKRYISNIFQTFNLISSYTVYQNVELVLLLNGHSKKEVKPLVLDILEKVGLEKYSGTKASKLSGGQKQRVAIARALARETPIIVADEPTGNLDEKSAADIIKLLYEISKDKLVIIVTHNYEQVEPYVTRKLTMHDGYLIEDRRLKERRSDKETVPAETKNASLASVIRLGVRNTFNLPSKFILLLLVFIFLVTGTLGAYTSDKAAGNVVSNFKINSYFQDISADRIVVNRKDGKELTEKDIRELSNLKNVRTVDRNDLIRDLETDVFDKNSDTLMLSLSPTASEKTVGKIVSGKLPENSNEVFILYPESNSFMGTTLNDFDKNREVFMNTYFPGGNRNDDLSERVTISGWGTIKKEYAEKFETNLSLSGYALMTEDSLNSQTVKALMGSAKQTIVMNETEIESSIDSNGVLHIAPLSKVPEGYVFIPEEATAYYKDRKAENKELKVINRNFYETTEKTFTVKNVYTEENYKRLLGFEKQDQMDNQVFMNPKDYNSLFKAGNYQCSVIMEKPEEYEETVKALEGMGYNLLYINKANVDVGSDLREVLNSLKTLKLAAELLLFFLISYFIVKLIFKSRNVYFSTIRMLGGTKGNCAGILGIDMFLVFNIAYGISMGLFEAVKRYPGYFGKLGETVIKYSEYMKTYDYFILYFILFGLTVLLAERYSRKMFSKTAVNAYREEV